MQNNATLEVLMDPIALVFIGLTFLLLLAAVIIPQMQNRKNSEES